MTLIKMDSILNVRWKLFSVLITVCLLSPSWARETEPRLVDRIVAVVNDELITLRELNKALELFENRIESEDYSAEKKRQLMYELRLDVLNKMINDKLTEQEIRRLDITVSQAEIDNAVERLKSANFYTDEQLREALARDGMTIEELRRKMKDQILRRHLIHQEVKSKIVITKEEVKRYYEAHPSEYGAVQRYHLRNIVMAVHAGADEYQKQQVLQQMQHVYGLLKDGVSFTGLARRYSQSLLASEGGDLGFFRIDELSPQIQQALNGKKAGEFTSILDTAQGYQIFYVETIEMQSPQPLEAVSAEISEKLYNEILDQKFESWLIELRKRSHIKIIQ